MGLFKKKDKNKQIEEKKNFMTSFDQMEYFIVKDRSNEEILPLADAVLKKRPVLVNLDKLSNADCNYLLAFMSGVVYAREGEAIKVGNKLFLFAGKEEFEDGSLYEYVEDVKQ